MVYLQITNRCNMTCEHCCNNCTAEGIDMSLNTVKKSFALPDEFITIGGGEPTIHPKFIEILMECIINSEYVFIITNGSINTHSLFLAKLAKHGVIGAALSLDDYHDPIDLTVMKSFQNSPENKTDQREIRNVSEKLINAGRCNWGIDRCPCSDIMILPDGTIKGCGCEDAPIFGNINTQHKIPEKWIWGECSKHQTGYD